MIWVIRMIVIFRNDAEYTRFIYNYETMPEVLFEKEIKNAMLRIINKFHVSTRINRIFNMPGKNIWYKNYLNYHAISKEANNIFIFMEGNALALDNNYIDFLRKRYPNSKMVFRFTNTITNYNRWVVDRIKSIYDVIVSMDKSDCKRYNWLYARNSYRDDLDETQYLDSSFSSDVFFIGRDKGRLEQLVKIYDELEKNNVQCLFLVSNINKNRRIYRKNIVYIQNLKYEEA